MSRVGRVDRSFGHGPPARPVVVLGTARRSRPPPQTENVTTDLKRAALLYGQVNRRMKRFRQPEDLEEAIRGTRYAEFYVRDSGRARGQLTDEGGYFTVTNPTPNTAVGLGIPPTFRDTAALFTIYNSASTNGPRVYLDFMSIVLRTAPVTSSPQTLQLCVKLDPDERLPTGPFSGATLLTPGNASRLLATSSETEVYCQPFATATKHAVAALGTPVSFGTVTDIAHIDDTNKTLRTYRFDGANWIRVGNALVLTTAALANPAMTALSSTRVALIDSTNQKLSCYDWDGTNWSQTGFPTVNLPSGTTITSGAASIAALSSTRVAFIDVTNLTLRAYDYTAATNSWAVLGTGTLLTTPTAANITALNATDIAFIDDTIDALKYYVLNTGTGAWTLSGIGNVIAANTTPTLTALSATRVAYIDATGAALRTVDWTAGTSTWAQVGNALTITTAALSAMTALSSTRIAWVSTTRGQLRAYNWGATDWTLTGNSYAFWLDLVASGSSARTVARFSAPNNLPLANDAIVVQFGRQDQRSTGTRGSTAVRATAAMCCHASAPPVVIGPGQWATIYAWWQGVATVEAAAALAQLQMEFTLGWWER